MNTTSENVGGRTGRGIHPLLVVVLAWLWFVLINNLRVEWTVNAQYGYGWAVPALCVFLLWKNQKNVTQPAAHANPNSNFERPVFYFLIFILALLYAPTRLVQEANPDWRLISWALALEVVGITIGLLRLAIGNWRSAIFPVAFFLVAVPWPTWLERTLIQDLTRVDANTAAELLGWFGIPAMPHGNVIEIATGTVGIDEACSGIRSFQATLMISLFLGEHYRLRFSRRAVLVIGGFALSFLFNLARMSLLVWVAARQGVPAIAAWHDPAGVTILLGCFFGLWGLGAWLRGKNQKTESGKQRMENVNPTSDLRPPTSEQRPPTTAVHRLIFALAAWILLSEISVEAWYRWHESHLPPASQWSVVFPTDNPTLKELPLPEHTRAILRYDEGRSAVWSENGREWQAIFLRWNPGRAALHLAENHTPDICLTAAGHTLVSVSPQTWIAVKGLRLPFSVNAVTDASGPFYVFYCLWDDRASQQGFSTMGLGYGNRLAPVLAGRRNPGQRSLEIGIAGPDNPAAAEAAVRDELEKILTGAN